MRGSNLRFLALLGAIIANGILAQEIPETFLACAALNNDAERLSCFDREMTRQLLTSRDKVSTTDSSETAVIAPEQARTTADVAPSTPDENRIPVIPAAQADAPTAVTLANSAKVSTDNGIGITEKPTEERAAIVKTHESEEPKKPDHIVAMVTDVDRQPHGEYIVALDNGQIWAEEFASGYFPVEVGDTVTIKKRILSGYRLVTESGKGFRVKRMR
jgi:hypothetical protein